MKKLLLATILMLGVISASAQDDKIKATALKNIEKSDATVQNPKKATKFTNWLNRAEVFIDAGVAYTAKLVADLPVAQMVMPAMIGEPNSIEEVEFFGQKYSKYIYDNFDMYVTLDGMVSFWEARKEVYPKAFQEALNALVKAKEIDEAGFMKSSKTKGVIHNLTTELNTIGRNYYTIGKFDKGGEAFISAYNANLLVAQTDTMSLYYAGLCFFEAKKYAEAEKIFENLREIAAYQDGMTFHYLSEAQKNLDKKEQYIKTLEEGFALFPESNTVMGGLINAYINENEDPKKLIDLITKAQSLDPKNVSLYLVESQIWDKIGDMENAYKALDKALEVDQNNVHAIYNYAIFKIMESDEIVNKANKLDLNDVSTYNKMMEDVETNRREAVTLLEKCLKIDAQNQDVISVLRQMYFVCRSYDGFQQKYDEFNSLHPTE